MKCAMDPGSAAHRAALRSVRGTPSATPPRRIWRKTCATGKRPGVFPQPAVLLEVPHAGERVEVDGVVPGQEVKRVEVGVRDAFGREPAADGLPVEPTRALPLGRMQRVDARGERLDLGGESAVEGEVVILERRLRLRPATAGLKVFVHSNWNELISATRVCSGVEFMAASVSGISSNPDPKMFPHNTGCSPQDFKQM